MRVLTVPAFAKINLTLRVLGVRDDGYHLVRTVLQSLALHDTLTFHAAPGAFRIECDDPACPADRTNLVWRAADLLWRAAARRGRARGVAVQISKRIPMQAGLGGGSSDAAAAIRGLSDLWRLDLAPERLHGIAASLGADVPFFLEGGTALGVDRGDLVFQLIDQPPAWVTLTLPPFGVSTKDAYGWFDEDLRSPSGAGRRPGTPRRSRSANRRPTFEGRGLPPSEWGNDLEPPVAWRYRAIAGMVDRLGRSGAFHAAMSGSGSAVYGLFTTSGEARAAARRLAGPGCRTIVTRTLNRKQFTERTRHP
ncbi:MAG: 4-(cytidine 5'-diphospho)-2-C-methyl-D-erythritol kinase [Acidobacteriota bacterium]